MRLAQQQCTFDRTVIEKDLIRSECQWCGTVIIKSTRDGLFDLEAAHRAKCLLQELSAEHETYLPQISVDEKLISNS